VIAFPLLTTLVVAACAAPLPVTIAVAIAATIVNSKPARRMKLLVLIREPP
jgi:hypothetical protein